MSEDVRTLFFFFFSFFSFFTLWNKDCWTILVYEEVNLEFWSYEDFVWATLFLAFITWRLFYSRMTKSSKPRLCVSLCFIPCDDGESDSSCFSNCSISGQVRFRNFQISKINWGYEIYEYSDSCKIDWVGEECSPQEQELVLAVCFGRERWA